MMTQGLSTITDRYDYDAWGNEYPIMVSTLDNPYRYVGQLGYYTHWMDSSLTDLLHLGLRFYEPGADRFGQVDPMQEDTVPYSYVLNRPMGKVDPTGMASNELWDMEKEMLSCLGECLVGFPSDIIKKAWLAIGATCFSFRGGVKFIGGRECITALANLARELPTAGRRFMRSIKCKFLGAVGLAVDALYCSQHCIRKLGHKWGTF